MRIKEEEFNKLKHNIIHMNYVSWKHISIHLCVFSALAMIASYIFHHDKWVICFTGFGLLMSIFNAVFMRAYKKEDKNFFRVTFITMCSILISSIAESMIAHPTIPSTVVYFLLLGFTALMFTLPVMIVFFDVMIGAICLVAIWFFKDPCIRLYDMVLCVCCTALSIAFGVNIYLLKIRSIEYGKKMEEELVIEKNKSHRHISALANLSREYRTVIYADFDSARIVDVYKIALSELNEKIVNHNVTNVFTRYADDFVYVEDKLNVKNLFNIEEAKKALETKDFISARYRIEENGLLVYYEMKIIRDRDIQTGYPVIIAVRNVDVEVRLDMVFQANFDEAKKNATKDLMTGVKNKGAFEGKCQELMQQLNDGNVEFAIVMCDVNGLKKANDTLGHEAGDLLIKGVCHIVSTIYTHSPVYRVGGDEFVAVLTGEDYQRRDELLKITRESALNNEEGVSFASGMATYDESTDKDVQSVFNRADEEMYKNKVAMKAQRED